MHGWWYRLSISYARGVHPFSPRQLWRNLPLFFPLFLHPLLPTGGFREHGGHAPKIPNVASNLRQFNSGTMPRIDKFKTIIQKQHRFTMLSVNDSSNTCRPTSSPLRPWITLGTSVRRNSLAWPQFQIFGYAHAFVPPLFNAGPGVLPAGKFRN